MTDPAPCELAAAVMRERAGGLVPRVGLILGSGLGGLAQAVDGGVRIPYAELPGFPPAGVHGHAGELVLGRLEGVPVACLRGRAHVYEGHGLAVMTQAVRALKLAGCETLLVTCAAGSLVPAVGPGALVALSDHINLLGSTPLVGPNDERFGPRFFSLADAYDPALRALLRQAAQDEGLPWHEGVYVATPGPCFETAAEIRMMQILGGHLVGMSTVPEVISARHCGLKVAAVATVTNLAEGLGGVALSHEQTLHHAGLAAADLQRLVRAWLRRLAVDDAGSAQA